MGAWGTGIFADDNAADLRDDYRRLIGDGMAGPEATDRLIAQWSPRADPYLEPVFWLALALTQWNCGRLEERVKAEALRAIADGSAIRPWAGGPDEKKRRAVLEAAKRKLESPQPAQRKIRKRVLATCDWQRGELIAYRTKTGHWLVLRVLDLKTDQGGTYPYCELLDWRDNRVPAPGLPPDTPVRSLRDYGGGTRLLVLPIGQRALKDRLQRLNVKHDLPEQYSRVPRGKPNAARVTSWKDFDALVERSYELV